MKCKKCGTEVDDRAKFCPVCGEPMGFGQAPQAPQPPHPNYAAGNSGNSGGLLHHHAASARRHGGQPHLPSVRGSQLQGQIG